MIKGIGCDFVSHAMTKKLKWDTEPDVLDRFFSENELIAYKAKKNIRFLAGRYAAKEAILKCLGTGMTDGLELTDIEILDGEDHKPEIKLHGDVLSLANELGIKSWFISITHAPANSLAFVVAEGFEN